MATEKYIKAWRTFLKEASHNDRAGKIYCDLDGVLVDFANPTLERMTSNVDNAAMPLKTQQAARKAVIELGRTHFFPSDIEKGPGKGSKAARDYMYRLLRGDKEFWSNLPWTSDGKALWNFIAPYKPFILTTPLTSDLEGSAEGKKVWVKKNLKIAEYRVMFSIYKSDYALCGRTPNVLIDDFTKNTSLFEKHGGISVLHVEGKAQSTIERLRKILEDDI